MQTPESIGGIDHSGNRFEQQLSKIDREQAMKQTRQDLAKLAEDFRQGGDRQAGEAAERMRKSTNALMISLVRVANNDGSLPPELGQVIAKEFSDDTSRKFIMNLLQQNNLRLQAENLSREVDGLPPTTMAGQVRGQLSDIVDKMIQSDTANGLLQAVSERTGLPIGTFLRNTGPAKRFIMRAVTDFGVKILEAVGMTEMAVELKVDGKMFERAKKLALADPTLSQALKKRIQDTPAAIQKLWTEALINYRNAKKMGQQVGPSEPTIQNVLLGNPMGLTAAPTATATEQGAKKEVAAENRPLGATAETIQDMPMSYVMVNGVGEFRVQKGSDTFKATAKHGNDAATVSEVTPIRQGTAPLENLTIKTRKGTEDLTRTVRAAEIKTALENNTNKRVTLDNVTLEFSRVAA